MASQGPERFSRRRFLVTAAVSGAAGFLGKAASADQKACSLKTRGVVILASDAETWPWIERAHGAALSTIALHLDPALRQEYVKSEKGQVFLKRCKQAGLQVEFEAHAMKNLLPRELFGKNPAMFRMNEQGQRVPDANLCVHSKEAMEVVCGNVVKDATLCRPTTGRYFFWIDDGLPMCRCPRCKELPDVDQAVLLENAILESLRSLDPAATLSHLAYHNTLKPPAIKPAPGVFLEFAPIQRRYDISVADTTYGPHAEIANALRANLAVFPADTAQILEYWLDVSRFSKWKRQGLTKIQWNNRVFRRDLDFYTGLGIRHVTTFAVWLDGEYVKRFGEPPLAEYACGLAAV